MIQRRILLAAGVAAVIAGPAFAQNVPSPTPAGSAPAQARRGGLLPQRAPTAPPSPTSPTSPVAPVSREELMRRFDLNADGRIDESEAEMARSRMRRDRAEVMRQSSIDPLTGRPRGAPPPEPAKEPVRIQAADVAPPAAKPKDDELLLVPGRPDGTPAPANAAQQPANAAQQQPASRQPANAARESLPTRQPPSAVTGGVRAGAPAARPGYGALGPKPDLNAGRQPTPPVGGMQPRVGGMQQRGMPGRTAPPTAGPTGRPSIGRAPTARPIPPPRITAEDIGQ